MESFEAAPDAQAENGQLKTAFQRSFDVVSCECSIDSGRLGIPWNLFQNGLVIGSGKCPSKCPKHAGLGI